MNIHIQYSYVITTHRNDTGRMHVWCMYDACMMHVSYGEDANFPSYHTVSYNTWVAAYSIIPYHPQPSPIIPNHPQSSPILPYDISFEDDKQRCWLIIHQTIKQTLNGILHQHTHAHNTPTHTRTRVGTRTHTPCLKELVE